MQKVVERNRLNDDRRFRRVLPLSLRTINSLINAGFLPSGHEADVKDVLTFLGRTTDAELYKAKNVTERTVCELRVFQRFFEP